MPIKTTQPITIAPGVVADKVAVSLRADASVKPGGIAASAVITGQRYHLADDGVHTQAGEPLRQVFPDVYALAAENPAVAAQVGAIQAALEALVPLLGL